MKLKGRSERSPGTGSPGKLRFMALGARLILAALHLTAQLKVWPVLLKYHVQLLGNAPHRGQMHLDFFGSMDQIYLKFEFLETFSFSFLENSDCSFLRGFLFPLGKKALHKPVRVYSGWWRGRVCNNKLWALSWLCSIPAQTPAHSGWATAHLCDAQCNWKLFFP